MNFKKWKNLSRLVEKPNKQRIKERSNELLKNMRENEVLELRVGRPVKHHDLLFRRSSFNINEI